MGVRPAPKKAKGELNMRYLLLVSHGTFAPGLHSVLDMLGGGSEQIIDCNLADGMGADEYVANLQEKLNVLTPEDEVVVLGDIMGGSPLTNALKVLSDRGMIANVIAFGGANLPMAMTAMMQLGAGSLQDLAQSLANEGKDGVKQIELAPAAAADDDDDI